MLKSGIMTSSVVLLIALSAAQSAPPPPVRVIDLTTAAINPAEWKIIASSAGGPMGTWPVNPSQVPVAVHLTNCALTNGKLYYSIEIENNRAVEARVPISVNSKLFDRKGTIRFRELLIRVGTASNAQDATSFKNDQRFNEVTLFGDQSVPGTDAVVAPGERLVFRLKSDIQSGDRNFSGLRAIISGFDETLSPSRGGYRKTDTWIPALFALSESSCSESTE